MKRIDSTNGNIAHSAVHYGLCALVCALPQREFPRANPTWHRLDGGRFNPTSRAPRMPREACPRGVLLFGVRKVKTTNSAPASARWI